MSSLIVAATAALLTAISVMMGLDHDPSFNFESALRLAQGQILYRDFHFPHGPVTPLLLWPLVALTPTLGYAVLLSSMLLSVAASLLVVHIVRETTSNKALPVVAGLLTAIWFLPPMGALFHDHLAYTLVLAGWAAFLQSRRKPSWIIYSGLFFALSFQTKQTVGGPALLALAAALFWGRDRLKWQWALGFLAGHLSVMVVVFTVGDLSNYATDFFLNPVAVALSGTSDKKWYRLMGGDLLFPYGFKLWSSGSGSWLSRLAFLPVVATAYGAYIVLLKTRSRNPLGSSLVFLLISTLLCACLLGRYRAFLFFGMGGVFALSFGWGRFRPPLFWSSAVLLAALGLAHTYLLRGMGSPINQRFIGSALYPIEPRQSKFSPRDNALFDYLKNNPGKIVFLGNELPYVALALNRIPIGPYIEFSKFNFLMDPREVELEFLKSVEKADVVVSEIFPPFTHHNHPLWKSLDTKFKKVPVSDKFIVYAKQKNPA